MFKLLSLATIHSGFCTCPHADKMENSCGLWLPLSGKSDNYDMNFQKMVVECLVCIVCSCQVSLWLAIEGVCFKRGKMYCHAVNKMLLK